MVAGSLDAAQVSGYAGLIQKMLYLFSRGRWLGLPVLHIRVIEIRRSSLRHVKPKVVSAGRGLVVRVESKVADRVESFLPIESGRRRQRGLEISGEAREALL